MIAEKSPLSLQQTTQSLSRLALPHFPIATNPPSIEHQTTAITEIRGIDSNGFEQDTTKEHVTSQHG